MVKPLIHPNWERAPDGVTDGYSLEMTAKDIESLRAAAALMPVDTPVAVTFLPGEEPAARVAATRAVRDLGFEPMPHFSARRITSQAEFEDYLQAVVHEAGVKRCFVVAGDPPEPQGPFFDTSALIATGAFERAGIKAIGIGGHPEGHPNMNAAQCWQVLEAKVAEIERRGMAPLIVTQFSFDPDAVLAWLEELRAHGIDAPVRVGIPGPAGIKTLLRFAARCGVGASASVMKKYGISITNLIGNAGPDKLVDTFAARLGEEHGPVRLHFYPFGGLVRTVEWIAAYAKA
ncbi:methylenetetrahydrofolate reductase (NADPH) [Novosphingobium sp. CF614]|uniref:methylenetetrahydrofolate reductase n=1 Tax=Novosphingobium sp. CF614 TaxID=1884364 RepID=UPI0008DF2ADA|nr:methylenetetrahydrofolate reductase [Novosphingobium sp. CF614]SFG45915.1 methylenetetrahydrofolate reductase (NADPH) [Novosphingobium sp. CF614]